MNDEKLCRYCGKNKTNCKIFIDDVKDMLEAVENHDLNKIKLYIQEGKSPNIHEYSGYTALHMAVAEEKEDIVEYLLSLPDINLEQRVLFRNKTPLILSTELKNPKIAKMLIKREANMNVIDIDGYTILHIAVLARSLETMRFILSEGFDLNLTDDDGKTPLHRAVQRNDFELVSMLLYYDADTDIIDNRGFTPFMTTLYEKNCDENIQRELFKYECDYNRETDYFGSTLALAVRGRSPLIIDLIKNGADVNYSGCMFDSILTIILAKCDPEIFFYVFPLTNLSILTECSNSIFISFLRCEYNKDDWLKALFLLLESDVLSELIDHYYTLTKKYPPEMKPVIWKRYPMRNAAPPIVGCVPFKHKTNRFGLFARFAEVFRKKNISEEEFVKFVEICLCSGAEVLFDDIETVYEVYPNNKALLHLLNMKI